MIGLPNPTFSIAIGVYGQKVMGPAQFITIARSNWFHVVELLISCFLYLTSFGCRVQVKIMNAQLSLLKVLNRQTVHITCATLKFMLVRSLGSPGSHEIED